MERRKLDLLMRAAPGRGRAGAAADVARQPSSAQAAGPRLAYNQVMRPPRSAALLLHRARLPWRRWLARQRFTKQDADRFQTKLTRIVEIGNAAPRRGRRAALDAASPTSR